MSDDVDDLLAGLSPRRRADAEALRDLMTEVTGSAPTLQHGSILGFGVRHYVYESGREGDTVRVGFAARRSSLVLYLTGYLEDYADQLDRLGPHRRGKGCLYITRLADVDEVVLRELVGRSFAAGASA